MRVFSRCRKIQGVSFHHRSSQRKNNAKSSSLSTYFDLEALLSQIRSESPRSLAPLEIRYYLCDQGRNEIHTHVSECTDFISKWTGIVKTMDRCFPLKSFLGSDSLGKVRGEEEIEYLASELEVFLSAKKLLALWKHRLIMFEMIVEAQDSLRFHKFSKTYR
jgi:hypothetical protein